MEPAGTPPDRLRGSKDRIKRSDGQAIGATEVNCAGAKKGGEMRELRKHRRRQRVLEALKKLFAAAGIFAGLMFLGTVGELETGGEMPVKTILVMLLIEGAVIFISYMAYQALDAFQDWENERYVEERRRHWKE